MIQKTSIVLDMIPSMTCFTLQYFLPTYHYYFISFQYYSNYKEDVWMKVVEILSYNQDVSFSFSLRLVSKRWESIFNNLTLNEATILNSNSLNWYLK
jgi:hypothetical protein